MKSSSPPSNYPPIVLQPLRLRHAPGADRSLALGEPVVPWRVWISSVKLSEFLQAAYRKVIVWFFCPVLLVWVVEPFDKVQNAAPFPGALQDLVNIVFLALYDIVGLSEDLRGLRRHSVFAGSIGFE